MITHSSAITSRYPMTADELPGQATQLPKNLRSVGSREGQRRGQGKVSASVHQQPAGRGRWARGRETDGACCARGPVLRT